MNVLPTILERLAWQTTSWTSIKVDVTTDYQFESANDQVDGTLFKKINHLAVRSTNTQAITKYEGIGNSGLCLKYESFMQGGVLTIIEYERAKIPTQKRVIIQKADPLPKGNPPYFSIPIPFQYWTVKNTPLHEVLSAAKPLGVEVVGTWQCEHYVTPQANHSGVMQDHHYFLDRETGLPVRFEAHHPSAGGSGTKILVSEWQVETLGSKGGYRYPAKTWHVSYNLDARGNRSSRQVRTESRVNLIEYNQKYPLSQFNPPAFESGVVVFDGIKKTNRTVGEAGKSAKPTPVVAPKVVATTTAEPLRTSQPRDWSELVSWSGMVLGSVTLAAGVVVLVRRGFSRYGRLPR